MHLNRIIEEELTEVFDALKEAFAATGTDHYIIGALARNIWYLRGDKNFRQTRDVDFAVLVGSEPNFEIVKQYLKEHKGFVSTKGNSFVMISPSGVQVDILPFGEIAIGDTVNFDGAGLMPIKINGFMEVYQYGTLEVEMKTGHYFKIATLPAIVLLKLIAFDDRPEMRSKDARDIAGIIKHFFELQAAFIYEKHIDLFSDENEGELLTEIAATVIGREIKKICAFNETLLERLKRMLQLHIDQRDHSQFVRNMIAETGTTVEESIKLLQNIRFSFND